MYEENQELKCNVQFEIFAFNIRKKLCVRVGQKYKVCNKRAENNFILVPIDSIDAPIIAVNGNDGLDMVGKNFVKI